jgi:hypothetical protein
MFSKQPTDDSVKPAFTDAAACSAWLGQLQLTNLTQAQSTLRKQLDDLNRYPLSGAERFQILELLRETVAMVQGNFARKLGGKKLPLSEDEFAPLFALSELWQSMLNGYLRCLHTVADEAQPAAHTALLCERTLLHASLQIDDFVQAGCEPASKLWLQLHAIFAHAEKLGVHKDAVADELYQPGVPVSCSTLYAATLLVHHARLTGISRSQSQIATRWLCQWSEALSVELRCSVSKQDAPPLAVDLTLAQGLMPLAQARQQNSVRYLAMVPLSKMIRVKTILLQQGKTPAEIDLGNDMSGKDCIELLNKLHAYWCESREPSLADTPRPCPSDLFCIGMDQIYAQISGKPYKPPKDASKSSQEAQRQIETFGRVLNNTGKHATKNLGFVPEEWLIEEDSLLRGRFLRLNKEGERLGQHQLISVFPPNSTNHKAAIIDMVRLTQHGQLYIAVHYFPGQPQAVIARGNTDNDMLKSGATAALLLPALEKLRIPASLVLPRDWFSPGRKLELNLPNNTKQNVVLGFSVEKGVDCERVSYKLA